ncbi:MAG: hypothetical protein IJT54_08155 [Candidatus Methanomethylophilaceae archaeon]|nr:hypothetical protein [Candidatus Methanomethylophilaceae archaeon]
MSTGAKIVLVIVLIGVVLGGIFVIGVGNQVISTHGEYTASVHFADSVTTNYGWTSTPDPGMIFVWADITMTNRDWSSGISNNTYNWKCEAAGIAYSIDSVTYSVATEHPYQLVEVQKGGTGTWTYIFQIPIGSDINDVKIKWDSQPLLDGKTVVA